MPQAYTVEWNKLLKTNTLKTKNAIEILLIQNFRNLFFRQH